MKIRFSSLIFFATSTVLFASAAQVWAAPAKTYQVTGPVLEIDAKTITVQKGKEKWEIARDAQSEVPADVKVGDKVTISYFMTASSVESKGGAKPDAKGGAKGDAKKKDSEKK